VAASDSGQGRSDLETAGAAARINPSALILGKIKATTLLKAGQCRDPMAGRF
jgi:hypothetical protein